MAKIIDFDNKIRELLLLALAIVYKNSEDAKRHILSAAEEGATSDEIMQALLIAIRKRQEEGLFGSRGADGFYLNPIFVEKTEGYEERR